MVRLGIDIGSTTAKVVVINEENKILFSKYERHNTKAKEVLKTILDEMSTILGDINVCVRITGSVGMGLSEQYSFPFIQEVVAATKAIQSDYKDIVSLIDIGGEDAKVVFFKDGEATDLRMNGNCAGGTGAFIDQMAVILGVDVKDLNRLALNATHIYPIASRCGVFCKTDIQNLIAKNVCREDIAASIFHAVAVQTVVTLAHGCDIKAPLLFCGGPLTFIPALRKAFIEYLSIDEKDIIIPENGTLLPALGAAMADVDNEVCCQLSSLASKISGTTGISTTKTSTLKPIFKDCEEYEKWLDRISESKVKTTSFKPGMQNVYIGIDSGSTTTKIVVTDKDAKVLFTYYSSNVGNPIETVEKGLTELKKKSDEANAILRIKGCCSTGYGEDLIKSAFQLDHGIVETMAHYIAASHFAEDVSFILDIGGQDMKAIFVNSGVIDRIEINEACSSGCGSFIESFAKTMNYTAHDFSVLACQSSAPCDLGTRCTVFMNSKVKQVLREGATINDISAGLAYSVVKNCLYKVLKLKDLSVLGDRIVVQGGTMRNDAIVRTLEILTGKEVTRCNMPELMGAYGCALYSIRYAGSIMSLDEIITKAHYTSRLLNCKGCDNQCMVVRYIFDNGKSYYSGNRCEKVFTNGENNRKRGDNAYITKNELLFKRDAKTETNRQTIGIPRCLNMYENYPFWHRLFSSCGINVVLSDASRYMTYERSARMVMSDNICFPAKLVHSHIQNLIDKGVKRIFMPFVVYEKQDKEQNSYNCPIVTGYSEVIKSVQAEGVKIDSPAITFKDKKLLLKQCVEYLEGLGIDNNTIKTAFAKAVDEQDRYNIAMLERNEKILDKARKKGELTILLAGRPYHTDFLIQHKVSEMMADMGINVITDDIVKNKNIVVDDAHFLSQWAYPNRILEAAKWCAGEDDNIQFVQMTSFGCGPDAFLVDEVKDMLMRKGKVLTLLKLDDINNIGSMKLRVRSLVESLKLSKKDNSHNNDNDNGFKTVPIYDKRYRGYKILVPYFTPFISPLIPSLMKVAGYDVESLPISDINSCDCGLEYANNEVCYPATLIVGDIIKALKSGRYDKNKTVVAMTQTGGQCRASNYVSLIKRALVNAGYNDVPVIAITFGDTIKNEQPGFKVNWLRLLPLALCSILYSDCIAKFYYASAVREKSPGLAESLKEKYLKIGSELILKKKSSGLLSTLSKAADEFNDICTSKYYPKVGIVGEIFLKFNPFAQKSVTDWLIKRGIEVVPPVLTDFFMQSFVNRKTDEQSHLKSRSPLSLVYDLAYRGVKRKISKINEIASQFRYFTPFDDIFSEADTAKSVITLNAQFGEGWLLPAEVMTMANNGVNNIISVQPFGCIANHIVAKGIEKRLKRFHPELNLLSLDFDSGVSDVNITNRLLLFIDKIKK
ncbi:MAG: acyl-CoA dehydratase activase-related protein [Prevotellaceae bacterium]|nr:acyl-CoA dehydratase activase-related protein [Prevotellaceae bacterium]